MPTKEAKKREAERRVYFPVPDVFLDCVGEPWVEARGDQQLQLNLPGILLNLARRMPVRTAGDSETSLEVLQEIRAAEGEPFLTFRPHNYKWFEDQLAEHAHNLLSGPDAAVLRHYLKDNKTETEPGPAT